MKIYKMNLLVIIFFVLVLPSISVKSTTPTISITSIGSLGNRECNHDREDALEISEDGNYILAGTTEATYSYATLIKIPDSFTGDFPPEEYLDIQYDTSQFKSDINHDGSSFVVMSYSENKVYCQINTSTVAKWVDTMESSTYDIEISGNGQYTIYTGHISVGMRTKFVHTSNGSEIWHFDSNNILICDTSHNGEQSIIGTWNGSLWGFDASSNQTLWSFSDPNFSTAFHIGISGDGSTVYAADSLTKYLFLIDFDSGNLLWSGSLGPSFSDVAISYDGQELLVITKYGYSAGNRILLFPRASMTAQWEIKYAANGAWGGITDNGKLAVAADANGNMMFIDCDTGSLLSNHTISDGVTVAEISPLGNTAAALTHNGLIYTYKIDDSSQDSTYTSVTSDNQEIFDAFFNSANYPALGITLVLGLLIGLIFSRLRRK